MALALLSYALVLIVVGLLIRRFRDYQFNKKYKLPPRIPGIPVFGNTLQLPPLKQGVWGIEMAKKYGEMCVTPPSCSPFVFHYSALCAHSDRLQVHRRHWRQYMGLPQLFKNSQ